MTPEQMAETVGQYILDHHLDTTVEYSAKMKHFKLKMPTTSIPPEISKALKGCTKETVTNFAGRKGRVRILAACLLQGKVLSDLKSLGQSHDFTDCVMRYLDEKTEKKENLGKEFYKQIERCTYPKILFITHRTAA